MLSDAAAACGVPLISGASVGFEGQARGAQTNTPFTVRAASGLSDALQATPRLGPMCGNCFLVWLSAQVMVLCGSGQSKGACYRCLFPKAPSAGACARCVRAPRIFSPLSVCLEGFRALA